MVSLMEKVEISHIIEEEKKKCIEKMKKYYNKYGDKHLQKLLDYLQLQLEYTEEEEIKNQLIEDIKIINTYL